MHTDGPVGAIADLELKIKKQLAGIGHLIDGEIVAGDGEFDVVAPWNGRVLAPCPDAGTGSLDRAMRAARSSQPAWAADAGRRRVALAHLAEVLDAHAEELGRVNSGLGREGGVLGLDAFCELKTVSVAFK